MSKLVQKILAWLAWLVTAAVGLVEIYLVRQIFVEIYLNFSRETAPADAIGWFVVLIVALISMAYLIGSFEYLYSRKDRPIQWSLFAWAASIELLILILYFVT